MKVALFKGPNNMSIEDINPWRVPKNHQLLKVLSCSVCSYDVRVYRNGGFKVKPPIVLGHEICAKTTNHYTKNKIQIQENTRVSVYPIIPCEKCWYCKSKLYNLCSKLVEIGSTLNGGYAEYIVVPNRLFDIDGIVPVPENVTNEEASLFEPLACCLNGIDQVNPSKFNSVVIIGDGPIGLIQTKLFKQRFDGMNIHIVGKIPNRLKVASQNGATKVSLFEDMYISSKEGKNAFKKDIPNLILVSNNNPLSLDLALKMANKNGQVLVFSGIKYKNQTKAFSKGLDPNIIHYNQTSILGSFSSTPKNLRDAMQMVSSKNIDLSDIISNKFPLSKIKSALKCAESYEGFKSIINKF